MPTAAVTATSTTDLYLAGTHSAGSSPAPFSRGFILSLFLPLLILATSTASAEDYRTPIVLDAPKKTYVLEQMRVMLETIANIQQDLANTQPEHVAPRVQAMQKNAADTLPAGLSNALPGGFRAMSKTMNSHWKTLATPTSNSATINGELANILNQCNACHRSYRIP